MSGFFGSSVVWGNIQGDITDQTDLDNRFKISEEQWRYYELFESKTTITGSITIPTEGQILLERYPENTSGLCVILDSNGRPLDEIAREEDGTPVTVTSLDANGNYTLSGLPDPTPFGIVYQIRIQHQYSNNVLESSIVNAWDANEPIKNFITVGASGCDFTSLKEACESITNSALDNPYAIHAFSSEFLEDPFKIPDFTTIVLFGARVCPNLSGDFIELGQNSVIRQGALSCGAINGATIYTTSTGSVVDTVRLEGTLTGTGFESRSGGQLTILNTSINNVENAFWANAGAMVVSTVSCNTCSVGLRVSNGGGIIGAVFGSFGGVTTDIQQDDDSSMLRVLSALINTDRIKAVDWDKIDITYTSDKEGDEAFHVSQEFSVGSPELGYESIMGEGDSYTRGMLVYTETSGGVFTDVSEEAASSTGSTFTFPGVAVDNSIYIASSLSHALDSLAHYGIKHETVTPVTLGGGNIILEYWNSTAWTEVKGMETDASGRYFPHADNYFQDSGSHQLRYNEELAIDSWTKNDPMGLGTDYYWVRFRIETAITTAPIFQQFKLHTNRMEVNADGWVEYYGTARPIGQLPFAIGEDKAFEGNLGNQTLYINEDVGAGLNENNFNGNNDKIGRFFFVPLDLDTSSPITLQIAGRPSGTGTAEFTILWDHKTEGDIAFTSEPALSPGRRSVTESRAVVTGEIEIFTFKLDVSDVIGRRENGQPDFIGLTIHSSNLSGTNFAMIALKATYTKWCEGGHI